MTGWQFVGDGPIWMPALNAAEDRFGIPANLLARVAYEESTFRPGVINGVIPSSVGALGLMQLMPQFFASVRAEIPFSTINTRAQIAQSGELLSSLHQRFSDWQVALAAYNWGGGNVHHEYAKDADKYILVDMPDQTQKYVKEIIGDVPLMGALIGA